MQASRGGGLAHRFLRDLEGRRVQATIPLRATDTYIVAIDPPSNSGLGRMLVPNLSVTAGAETSAGTVVLP